MRIQTRLQCTPETVHKADVSMQHKQGTHLVDATVLGENGENDQSWPHIQLTMNIQSLFAVQLTRMPLYWNSKGGALDPPEICELDLTKFFRVERQPFLYLGIVRTKLLAGHWLMRKRPVTHKCHLVRTTDAVKLIVSNCARLLTKACLFADFFDTLSCVFCKERSRKFQSLEIWHDYHHSAIGSTLTLCQR